LATAIEDFVLNELKYKKFAENGRKHFEENFTLDKFMLSLEQLLKSFERSK